jgi:hypothetical protein
MRYTVNMATKEPNKLARAIRDAIERDDRSLYAITKAAELAYQSVHPFARGQRTDISLATADALCRVLGLELQPKARSASKRKAR